MNDNPTFTPGPWRAEGPDPFGDWNILHDGDALAIGAVVSNMRPAFEVAANARLEAAAPQLYEALKGIVTESVKTAIARHHAKDCRCNYCVAIAALAKAEGRS